MMKQRFRGRLRWPALLAILFFVGACSARPEDLSQLPPDNLYGDGVAAFEAGNWNRSITLLEFFVNAHLGDPRVPEARMMLGEAHMARQEYTTAATHFLRLVTDFPSSPLAIEARYLVCDSYYRLSPEPPLDQEYTLSALLHCQSVADYFPGTTEATQAMTRAVELRDRLARKTYLNGLFYFRRRAYDSAIVYFQEVVAQYPETTAAPAALSQLIETFSRLGYVEDADETRQRLLQEYPQSSEAQALQVS